MAGWMYVLIGQDVCFSTPRAIVAYVWHSLVKEVWDMIVVSLSLFHSFLFLLKF